jgi:hypothetical protein
MPSLLCRLSFISSTVGQGLIITYLAYKIHKEWGEVWSIRTIYTQAHHIHPCHVKVWSQTDRKWRRTGSLAGLGTSGLLLNLAYCDLSHTRAPDKGTLKAHKLAWV